MKLSQTQIRGILPHRYPILLVDRVLELAPGDRITAIKAVTCNEPCYLGAPDDATDAQLAYPQTLLIESWGQAAAIVASTDTSRGGQVILFGGATDVEFHSPVYPGEVLVHRARVTRTLDDTVIFSGETVVGIRNVLTIGMATLAFRPAEQVDPATKQLEGAHS